MGFDRQRTGALAVLTAVATLGTAETSLAAPPPPELMERLAAYGARLESMRTHASYRLDGKFATLDRSGHEDSLKELKARIDTDGIAPTLTVLTYTEDGEDKTEDAQKKARDSEKRRREKADKPTIHLPIVADQQARYVFDQVDTDAADPSRVKISFVPKKAADDTIEGSAWVDARTGALISAGFKLNRTSMFVDYVHFTVEFGESTRIGPAVSSVHVEGQGGLLMFRKRFRGTARVHDYVIVD